nr:carbamate kinase [Natronomonas sp. CBA1123]
MALGAEAGGVTRLVVAVGGNALAADGTFEAQHRTVRETASSLADAVGNERLVVTHGNGPQVGNVLLEAEAADTPDRPLDVLVAETQASLGGLLQRHLDAALDRSVAALLTRVLVDTDDAAFDAPTKPVGPWYAEVEAERKPFETKRIGSGERPFRRVVASPEPTEVLDAEAVDVLLSSGQAVVCGGGGGIPLTRTVDGFDGVEAVVDKDHTTRLIAEAVDADRLVFLTDVSRAYLDYGTDDQRPIESVDAETARSYLEAGEFDEGSMAPKMRACAAFAEAGGEAVVADIDAVESALAGEAGTVVHPANNSDS